MHSILARQASRLMHPERLVLRKDATIIAPAKTECFLLTRLTLDKFSTILADYISKCILLNENDKIPNHISLKLVPRTSIDNTVPVMMKFTDAYTVYPKKYAHGFVVLCFVVVMQSFIMNWHEVFIHIHQGCFAGTGAIVRLPQCQWSKPDGYGKISQCITTTKHSKAKTVCIFLGIYCMRH